MIVTDEQVETALAYLNATPSPIGLAKFELTKAENEKELRYATLFLVAEGKSVRDRECFVEASEAYTVARNQFAEATGAYEEEKARVRGAEMVIECWRTANANQRAAERIR